MTIAIYCNVSQRVYVDSRISWDNGRPPEIVDKTSKINWNGETVTVVATGPSVTAHTIALLALKAIDDGTYVVKCELPAYDGCAYFLAYKGIIWFTQAQKDKTTDCSDVVNLAFLPHDVVSGSGGGFYSAYKAEGLSCFDAITKTARFHTGCGLPIRSFGADGSVITHE